MDKIIIRVLDFAEAPGPRFMDQGVHSGEEFYVKVLNGAMARCLTEKKEMAVELDGTAGYPSSFLDQAFGELVYDFSRELVEEKVEIVTVTNKRRKAKLFSETYPQWEQKRKSQSALKHSKKEYELFFINEEGELSKRIR